MRRGIAISFAVTSRPTSPGGTSHMNIIERISYSSSTSLPPVGGTLRLLPAGLFSAEASQGLGVSLADFVAHLRDSAS
jgi:hypothetical protein